MRINGLRIGVSESGSAGRGHKLSPAPQPPPAKLSSWTEVGLLLSEPFYILPFDIIVDGGLLRERRQRVRLPA